MAVKQIFLKEIIAWNKVLFHHFYHQAWFIYVNKTIYTQNIPRHGVTVFSFPARLTYRASGLGYCSVDRHLCQNGVFVSEGAVRHYHHSKCEPR